MTVIFHPEAEVEYLVAISYYESAEPGLGADFHNEVLATIGRITRSPGAWPVLQGDVRRCLCHRFPYGVLYSIEPDAIYILAVMHLRRHQDYWKHRA